MYKYLPMCIKCADGGRSQYWAVRVEKWKFTKELISVHSGVCTRVERTKWLIFASTASALRKVCVCIIARFVRLPLQPFTEQVATFLFGFDSNSIMFGRFHCARVHLWVRKGPIAFELLAFGFSDGRRRRQSWRNLRTSVDKLKHGERSVHET